MSDASFHRSMLPRLHLTASPPHMGAHQAVTMHTQLLREWCQKGGSEPWGPVSLFFSHNIILVVTNAMSHMQVIYPFLSSMRRANTQDTANVGGVQTYGSTCIRIGVKLQRQHSAPSSTLEAMLRLPPHAQEHWPGKSAELLNNELVCQTTC